jgi:hypothetical protein
MRPPGRSREVGRYAEAAHLAVPSYPRRVNANLPNDTYPRIEALLIQGYRAMSAAQKLERVRALTRAVQELALLNIRRRHRRLMNESRPCALHLVGSIPI